ncbi:hypothetical protein KAN5_28590 [Pseudoalteromonas sp. KAN5]|nr:hypothetical protein KAN5_28590 [Pseudoalteromonas sp. KAN5]
MPRLLLIIRIWELAAINSVPNGLVDVDKLRVFCITDLISLCAEPDSIVLDISFDNEEKVVVGLKVGVSWLK